VDREDVFPAEGWARLWEAGFLDLTIPRQYGGKAAESLEAVVVVEELAQGSAAAGLIVLLQALGVNALRFCGDEKRAGGWLRRVVEERLTLAFALSEPEDAAGGKSVVTTARKVKSDFLLEGRKTFVSGAREADLVVVFAVTSPRAGLKRALSAFVVESGTAGMIPGREESKSGLRGAPSVDLVFEKCRVPRSSLLPPAGGGYHLSQRAILATAPLVAALSCGLLTEALEYALDLTRRRGTASRPLSEFQPLQLAVAETTARLDASRALTWAAARAVDEGLSEAERLTREAKWTATEAAVEGIDALARLSGIAAVIKGAPLERLSRDARVAQLLLGPNHIHRIEAARKLLQIKALVP
jgi:alkylation response protein AidB-like acyl-CoA dehydrogenase